MKRSVFGRTTLSIAVAGALTALSSQALASGFALIEENASGLGNSFAGAAAVAEDASTIFYNPAGLSLLPSGPQISVGADYIHPSSKFSDSSSTAAPGRPLGGNGGDAFTGAVVPNLYFAMDVAPNWKFGLGVTAPFGLKTEYDSNWIGRFQAIKSDIKSTNINPTVAYKVSDTVSVGFGLDYQKFQAEFTNAINTAGFLSPTDDLSTLKADDTKWGYNAGAMFQLDSATRLGVSYRSPIKYKLEGTASISGPVPIPSPGNISVDLKTPDTLSFAVSHRLDPKWTLLGDITRTGWSSVKDLTVVSSSSGGVVQKTPENFKDTWRVGVGSIYKYSDAWALKLGVAYDPTPVNDTDRTARLPDSNRLWASVGGQYRLSPAGTLDFGYVHIFMKDASINQANPVATSGGGSLVGSYKNSVNLLGVQLAYRF